MLTRAKVDEINQNLKSEAILAFNKLKIGDEKSDVKLYHEILENKLNEAFETALQSLKDKLFVHIDKYLSNIVANIERNLRKGDVYSTYSQFFKELTHQGETFENEFPLMDLVTKSHYWKLKTKRLVNNGEAIGNKDKLQVKILEEKCKMSDSNIQNLQKQYENVIKSKNEKIMELEIENELLRKRGNLDTNSKNTENLIEVSSPLTEINNISTRKRRQNSNYFTPVSNENALNKLKEDYKKIYDEKQKLKNELEKFKASHTHLLNLCPPDGVRSSLSNLDAINTADSNTNLKELLKKQIEENKRFREMLTNFIDHKSKKVLYEDMDNVVSQIPIIRKG